MFPSEKIYTDSFHPHLIFHRVEGGTFMMGGADEEAIEREKPVHKVQISTFYMARFPVTQSLWLAVMGNNPSEFKGDDNRPVENVSWMDIVNDFLPKLKTETGLEYRLPTEAEWEFAARGGNLSVGYLYAGSDKLKQVGWYADNSDSQTHPVGEKMANELGLQDMSGNVWEWCADHWHSNYNGAPEDGSAWLSDDRGAFRVLRGGGSFGEARFCRSAYRYSDDPGIRLGDYGFRLPLSPGSWPPEARA